MKHASKMSKREMHASPCRGDAHRNARASCLLFSHSSSGGGGGVISPADRKRKREQQQPQGQNTSTVNYCANRTFSQPALLLILLFIANFLYYPAGAQQSQSGEQHAPPTPVQSASYVSLDGLALVIIFDRPLNLSASIESVEQRHAAAAYESESRAHERRHKFKQPTGNTTSVGAPANEQQTKRRERLSLAASSPQSEVSFLAQRARQKQQQQAQTCKWEDQEASQETPHLIGGVQLCAHLLSRKTLKLLHKHKLFSCLWASQVQFLIQLGKPIGGGGGSGGSATASRGVRVAFRRGTLSGTGSASAWNEQEVAVELSKLPLEGLGVPLSPRLALTGPNQVPPCGQFSISAHLSSPYGTQPEESVRLRWSVERRGMIATTNGSSSGGGGSSASSSNPQMAVLASGSQQPEVLETQWQALRQMVAQERSNHLVLDARLLQFVPQLYEFRLEASFTTTSMTTYNLNASHQVGRLDFDTPIGTIYGSHLLALDQQLNTNQDLGLVADVQVPECAHNIKQVGLYWQVSDPRVRFDQTYAPFYLAKSGTLPEQALIEFRLNLFYGIRVKKFASAGTLVPTGESLLDAQISDGLLMASVGQPQDLIGGGGGLAAGGSDSTSTGGNLELFAISRDKGAREQQDKFTYQWSCFDGKTAQPCHKSLKLQASSGGTRYDVGTPSSKALLARPQAGGSTGGGGGGTSLLADGGQQPSPLLLVDRARQRQATLKLPLSWLDSDAQLWFGLQRFDRANPSQHSKTEYALVSVHPVQSGLQPSAQSSAQQQPVVVSIGPVLIGRSRQRATIRNPLTGAIVLVANAPALVVGRLSAAAGDSFTWRSPNYPHPLHWTTRNVTNPLNGQEEILTELHLDQEMLLAHAHHQIQLSVCAPRAGQRGTGSGVGAAAAAAAAAASSTASVSLDVVQGVTQCRVELLDAAAAGSGRQQAMSLLYAAGKPQVGSANQEIPLVVTVNYCNIPLGLSPVTYQLYIIDTSASDGFVATSGGSGASQSASSQPEEEYLNEADVQFYEAQAQPLSVPQLSPVFSLGAMSALTLTGVAGTRQQQQPPEDANTAPPVSGSATRVRFSVRVCDRLPSCQMFYSSAIDPLALLRPAGHSWSPSATPLNQSLALGLATSAASVGQTGQRLRVAAATADDESQVATVRALHQMLDAAKRANTAGNSIAAIAIVNAVVQLGQRRLAALGGADDASARRSAQPPGATSGVRYSNSNSEREGEGEDSSAAAAAAENRTENSNRSSSSSLSDEEQELARAQLRELVQLAMRDCLLYGARSIQRHFHYTDSGQTNLVLAAMSRIVASPLAGFELKFRSLRLVVMLVRKTLDLAAAAGSASATPDSVDQHVAQLTGRSAPDFKTIQQTFESLFSTLAQHSTARSAAAAAVATAPTAESSSTDIDQDEDERRRGNNATRDLSRGGASGANGEEMLARAAHHLPQQVSPLKAAGRRNKEEAILAYLRLARTAHRALLQSAASQLTLGAVQSFEYQSPAGGPGALGSFALAAASNSQLPGIATSGSSSSNNNFVEAAKFLAGDQPPAHIISSLTHQTQLIERNIELDLREFGQVSVRYGAGLSAKLARLMRVARLRCRATGGAGATNDTQSKCSSFVLALTTYAGKAPFRSLDLATSRGLEVNRLRVPVVQVDWLSPLDGTSLIELLNRHHETSATTDDLLTLDDFRSSVTFTLPARSDTRGSSSQSAEPYKCYKFDEQANEWTLVATLSLSSARAEKTTPPPPPTDGSTAEQTQVLKCAYDGFGALGAFRGGPPSSVDTPMELSIAVGVGLILAVVSIFSILGCMASKARRRKRPEIGRADEISSSGSSSSAAAALSSYDDDVDAAESAGARRAAEMPRHLAHGAMARYR